MNPDLLTNIIGIPEVSRFYQEYQPEQWPELTLNLILYSIYALRSAHSAPPQFSYLQDLIKKAGMIVSLENVIPTMQEKLTQIKNDITRLESELQIKKSEKAASEDKAITQSKSMARSSSAPSKAFTMASRTDWRKGDTNVFRHHMPENKPAQTKNVLFRETSPPVLRDHKFVEVFKENDNFEGKFTGSDIEKAIYPEWWKNQGQLEIKHPMPSTTGKITQRKPPPLPKPQPVYYDRPQTTKASTTKPKRNAWKISPKSSDENVQSVQLSEKGVEANLDTPQSTPENHVRFESSKKNPKQVSIKKPGWAADFSEVVKRSPGSSMRHSSQSDSRQQSSSSHSMPYSPQDFQRPLQESQPGKTSSGYTGSSMTHYNPTEEMKLFFQNEFTNFLESRGTEGSGQKRQESSYYSESPSSGGGSYGYDRNKLSTQGRTPGMYRA